MQINKLSKFNDKTFIWLEKLENFDLSSNELVEITEKSFEGLKSMKELDLFFNKISKLHSQSFEMMMDLESLHLGYNELEIIPPKLLIKNANLNRLILTSNRIKSIDFHLFDFSPSLAQISMENNKCTDSSMQMQTELISFKRSIVHCITSFQRMEIDNLKLTLPDQLENDFGEVKTSWKKLSELSNTVHETSRQLINSMSMQLNNLTNSLQLAVVTDQKSVEVVDGLKQRLNFNGKYYQVHEVLDTKFIILLTLQITSFTLLLITILSIIYGMWKIKQKVSS